MSARPYVNIVLSDRSWILEKLANEIIKHCDYVRADTIADPEALIQYYMTYSTRRRRVSPIEIGYFTHIEEAHPDAKQMFFRVASEVEHCVCHAKRYEDALRAEGVQNVTTIPPGVSLDTFKPVVKIGVVGRTYHTGRKGEALLSAVLDLPGIEWRFTGDGWPLPGERLLEEEMPQFYNELDFVLVPSLYEGGPMCVAEALACGVPVIAPPIGWVTDFPHRPFKKGDAEDLRRVLNEVVAERNALRENVLQYGWPTWAGMHDELFRKLMQAADRAPEKAPSREIFRSAALVTHGVEKRVPGGPSVRVPKTAAQLTALGFPTSANFALDVDGVKAASLLHVFNLWHPASALAILRRARALDRPLVFSPITLDLSEHQLWASAIPNYFRNFLGSAGFDAGLKRIVDDFARDVDRGHINLEIFPGLWSVIREMVDLSDHVILLSEKERSVLDRIGAKPRRSSVVHNPVDAAPFVNADAGLFAQETGLQDYILCVGRIEMRKNQLMLAYALRNVNIPLVFLGEIVDPAYAELVRTAHQGQAHFLGRRSADDPLLASAYAGARVVVLPSWSEGAPLVALEGAAAGKSLVLSNKSAEREYFGDFARYCDPADPASIRTAILEAYEAPLTEGRRNELRQFIQNRFSYDEHVSRTLAVYHEVLADVRPPLVKTAIEDMRNESVVVDLTHSVECARRGQERPRLESIIATEITGLKDKDVRFVAFDSGTGYFYNLSRAIVTEGDLSGYMNFLIGRSLHVRDLPRHSRFIVAGQQWENDANYSSALVALSLRFDLKIVTLFAQPVSPSTFSARPHDLEPSFGETAAIDSGVQLLLAASSQLVAFDSPVLSSIEARSLHDGIILGDLKLRSPGDEFLLRSGDRAALDAALVRELEKGPFVLFVNESASGIDFSVTGEVIGRLVDRLQQSCPLFVVAGRADRAAAGSSSEPVFPERAADRMKLLPEPSDATLDWLYSNCILVVDLGREGVSRVIGEAMVRGAICLSGNSTAKADRFAGVVDYMDPIDALGWAARIEHYVKSQSARERRREGIREGYAPKRWSDVVVSIIHDPIVVSSLWNKYALGNLVLMGNRPGQLIARSGWHAAEDWGCWSSARVARFTLTLREPVDRDLWLVMQLRAPQANQKPIAAEVVVNGRIVGRLTLNGNALSLYAFPAPASSLTNRCEVQVEIRAPELELSEQRILETGIERRIGIGVGGVALVDTSYPVFLESFATDPAMLHGVCRYGETIDFRRSTRTSQWSGERVADPAWGLKVGGTEARIAIKVFEQPSGDLSLIMRYRAVAREDRPLRLTIVLDDGTVVGSINATDDTLSEIQLDIPAESRRQPFTLEFVGCDSRSPYQLGVGSSMEQFALGVFTLSVGAQKETVAAAPSEPNMLGKQISLSAYRRGLDVIPAMPFLDSKTWFDLEPEGAWAFGKVGRLDLPMAEHAGEPLRLRLGVAACATPTAPITVEILLGGRRAASFSFSKTDPAELECDVEPTDFGSGGVLAIEVCADKAVAPSYVMNSTDDRLLGAFLCWVKLSRKEA